MNAVSQSSLCALGGIRIRSWKPSRNTRRGVRVIVRRSLFVLSVVLAAVCVQAPASAACPSQGASDASLVAVKAAGFEVADARTRETLAFDLIDCLASPDPTLRDGIAYEGLQHWLRAKIFSPETRRALQARLFALLEAPDQQGVARPFAALVLSEVARTDRIEPWMHDDERVAMVERAAKYLESVDDYRGYASGVGWRRLASAGVTVSPTASTGRCS